MSGGPQVEKTIIFIFCISIMLEPYAMKVARTLIIITFPEYSPSNITNLIANINSKVYNT